MPNATQTMDMWTCIGQNADHSRRQSPEQRPRPLQPHNLGQSVGDAAVSARLAHRQPRLNDLHWVYHTLCSKFDAHVNIGKGQLHQQYRPSTEAMYTGAGIAHVDAAIVQRVPPAEGGVIAITSGLPIGVQVFLRSKLRLQL